MIPVPVYCRRCGGFTGKHLMLDKGATVTGEHEDVGECLERLNNRILRLEDMNKTTTRLIITAQCTIEHTGEYEAERDKRIEELESLGWNVEIETEDDEDD